MRGISLGAVIGGLAAMALALAAQTAHAASLLKDGFVFPTDHAARIIVFRPDVRVGTLRSAGEDEPNAEWTEAARKNIAEEMKSQAAAQGLSLDFLGDLQGADAELLDQYRSLFVAVSGAVNAHGFANHLPTKLEPKTAANPTKRWRMDWTLGPGAAQLKGLTGADYALFIYTHDAYGSNGRKAAVIFAAMWGVSAPFGVHEGYAALVDLATGDLVWFNTDPAIGGDPRDHLGANKRVSQLLAGFPGGKAVVSGAATAAAAPTR